MPISFDTWLASQTPDLLAESMGLPPLARVGKSILQAGLSIGTDAASTGADPDDARASMALTIAQYLDDLSDDDINELSRAVNIARGVWIAGAERVEDRDQRRLLAQFIRRVADNVYGTYLALRVTDAARPVGLISGEFVGTIVANVPPLPDVTIDIGDIIIRPRGSSLVEGSFSVNGVHVPWRYVTPTVTLPARPGALRSALSDDELEERVATWMQEQAEQLALAARAEATADVQSLA